MRRRLVAAIAPLAIAASLAHAGTTPRVALVQPSGSQVPASLLRISIRFEKAVADALLARLSLRHADDRLIAEPFLQQELWSPDRKSLTVLLHPGRVKTGLQAREALGPILEEGDDVVLALDGRPLQRWHVGPVDESGPIAAAWTLSQVHAGVREPLRVRFDAPIDGQDANYVAVADQHGRRVTGRAMLGDGEDAWTFVPDRPWLRGEYRLVVRGTLEDASGNRMGSHFETSAASPAGRDADVVIPFATVPRTY